MAEKIISEVVILDPLIHEASIPELYNVECILADTEYSFNIAECRKFTIKARDGNLKLSFYPYQSNLIYILLVDGQSISEDLLHSKNLIIYFQSSTLGCVAEIILWL